MKKFVNEFKEFIIRGNVVDLAVGVVIGTAFAAIINSVVTDIIMPVVSLLTGRVDFANLFIALDGKEYATLEEAIQFTSVISYGNFIRALVQFVIITLSIFIVIKSINKMRKNSEEETKIELKNCQYCKSEIHIEAVKCPCCASELQA